MKITPRARADRPGTMQVTFELPRTSGRNRVRRNAPAGFDEAQALAWGEKMLADIIRENMLAPPVETKKEEPKNSEPKNEVPQVSATMTVADFWRDFMENGYFATLSPGTRIGYRQKWRDYIAPVLGALPLDAIEREHIRALRAKIKALKANGSRNCVLTVLRTIFTVAVAEDIIDEDVVPRVGNDTGGTKRKVTPHYNEDERDLLLEAAQEIGGQHLVSYLLQTDGCLRIMEVASLEWGDVDLAKGKITVKHNVSGGESWLPKHQDPDKPFRVAGLTPELREALEALPRGKRDEPVLPYPKGGRHTRWTLTTLNKHIQKRAGVKVWSPHKMKHTGVTAMADAELDPYQVQAQAGHADLSTTKRYTHTDQEKKALAAAAALGAARAARAARAPMRDPEAPQHAKGPYGPN